MNDNSDSTDDISSAGPNAPVSLDIATALLRDGRVEEWNRLRADHPDWRPDLTKVQLTGAQLPGVNLAGCKLTVANLIDANLANADLREANLRLAVMNTCVLVGRSSKARRCFTPTSRARTCATPT
ncbi:MAG: pentapeptide repeat-containing protein [Deltaproteobacteria bacterium]|nr:pentapeptide repeat-containing protein [Deltaproteobacteria bacterium]